MSAVATSSDKQFSIRTGTKQDCPTVLDFIKQLAEYEKEPDAVKATVETLEKNVFEKGYAEVLIAEQHKEGETTPVGMALVSLIPFLAQSWVIFTNAILLVAMTVLLLVLHMDF